MAAHTFKKDRLGITGRITSDHLSTVQEELPEGASQTFLAGALVVITGGYIVECSRAGTTGPTGIYGMAVADAHNAAAGLYKVPVVRFIDGHELYGSLLTNGATPPTGVVADLTLTAAHLGAQGCLLYADNLRGTGLGGWYIGATAGATAAVEIVSFRGDQVPSPAGRLPTNEAQVGDINARVRVRVLPAVIIARGAEATATATKSIGPAKPEVDEPEVEYSRTSSSRRSK